MVLSDLRTDPSRDDSSEGRALRIRLDALVVRSLATTDCPSDHGAPESSPFDEGKRTDLADVHTLT
jgi:hypothetical protein